MLNSLRTDGQEEINLSFLNDVYIFLLHLEKTLGPPLLFGSRHGAEDSTEKWEGEVGREHVQQASKKKKKKDTGFACFCFHFVAYIHKHRPERTHAKVNGPSWLAQAGGRRCIK